MSPRAAWRLETLGFTLVYIYAAGKSDWGAAGLPLEGEITRVPRVADIARRDVPTCGLDERVGAIRERVRAAGWDTCFVVTEGGVVLGRLNTKELDLDPRVPAERVMRNGPSTFRPNVSVPEMLDYMRKHKLHTAPITTGEGRLVGLVRREDAEAIAGPPAERTSQ